jgi:hypothetical protein
LADELGISVASFHADIIEVKKLLDRIRKSNLKSAQRRILTLIVENSDFFDFNSSSIPARVIESDAGYDYQSREFIEEMGVLEYKGLASIDGDDGTIQLSIQDYEARQTIVFLCDKNGIPPADIINEPSLDLLIS